MLTVNNFLSGQSGKLYSQTFKNILNMKAFLGTVAAIVVGVILAALIKEKVLKM